MHKYCRSACSNTTSSGRNCGRDTRRMTSSSARDTDPRRLEINVFSIKAVIKNRLVSDVCFVSEIHSQRLDVPISFFICYEDESYMRVHANDILFLAFLHFANLSFTIYRMIRKTVNNHRITSSFAY